MPNSTSYDLIVIGGGSGGVASARRAASYGAKVALVEADRLGGTCVIRGCIPKKLMMYSGQFGAAIQDGLQPGWTIQNASFDMAKWQHAKSKEIERLEGVYNRLLDTSGVEVIRGHAQIESATQVRVGSWQASTRRILIATGGTPSHTAFDGLELAADSNGMLDLDHLPKGAGIVGAGYIALEFACILRGLGVAVSMFYREGLPLRGCDESIREKLADALTLQGIEIHTQTQFKRIRAKGKELVLETGAGEHTFDFILNATGRHPNTKGLGLEKIGVQVDEKGAIVVDAYSKTNVDGVFAVGDVTNRVNLTPVAIAQGRAVAENEFNGQQLSVKYDAIPTAVFTSPPVGMLGLTQTQAAQNGRVRIYETEFTPMKTAFSGGQQKTFMKLVVDDASDKILGIHILGEDAPEMIQSLGVAFTMGATKADFDKTMAVHPTSAEEWVLMRQPVRVVG